MTDLFIETPSLGSLTVESIPERLPSGTQSSALICDVLQPSCGHRVLRYLRSPAHENARAILACIHSHVSVSSSDRINHDGKIDNNTG
ncbi:hypothetical protein A6X21_20440 [Planctopirus hydrillae]|uniref:Uncharacterized protein n=1 Tax=Planctopirus hydrillae TaxID=1841610 RepID=A0A1C3EHK5_9PLAN|nr:hypothetical protein A6X21_20440 [Planctopirus hydrillae]